MNLQQLEYLVAIDKHRHFARAAEACFVTQATLSTMVRKLEAELGVVLFDRSRQPVLPTLIGEGVIAQSRQVLQEVSVLQNLAHQGSQGVQGNLRLGVIPTLAPYLLPPFLSLFLDRYPAVTLKIQELNTESLLQALRSGAVDAGILATPLPDAAFKTAPLFQEAFQVFVSPEEKNLRKKYILPEDLDINKLWLLEEGHCLRSQVLNLCELQKRQATAHHLEYETGSIESLLKLTELNKGITIIPELATVHFTPAQRSRLRHFKPPVPVREISLVTYRHLLKAPLLAVIQQELIAAVAPLLGSSPAAHVVPIHRT